MRLLLHLFAPPLARPVALDVDGVGAANAAKATTAVAGGIHEHRIAAATLAMSEPVRGTVCDQLREAGCSECLDPGGQVGVKGREMEVVG